MIITAMRRRSGMGYATMAAFMFAALCFGWLTFKNFEPKLWPVVSDFDIKRAYISGNSILISGTMDKRRSCQINDVLAYSGKRFIAVQFLEDQGTIVSRLPRVQSFGPWALTPKALDIEIYATHTCSTGSVVTQLFDGTLTVSNTKG